MNTVTKFKPILAMLLLAVTSMLAFHSSASAQSTDRISFNDARHLLTRTGFGASPFDINELTGKSVADAVDSIVAGLEGSTHTTPPAWIHNNAPYQYQFANLSTADKQKFRQVRLHEVRSLQQWWIQEMISTPDPQKERLILFWHNHFATAYSGLNDQSISIARQHIMLRDNAAGNFRVLLKNIIRDPAMLNYLDNNNSKKQKPNENLARELMELFSLGEGNYAEADIKNAARALTGYSFSAEYDMRFVFKPWTHDRTTKTIFGKTGDFDGDDLVDLILEQPQSSRFITAKFWRMLIGEIDNSDNRLTTHANAFRDSDYDIKTLYKSLLLSDDFWHQDNRATLVKSPVSLTVGAIRTTGILPANWQTLPLSLRQMGQYLFEPPNVAGWPGGASWIAPGRLLTRLEWLGQLDAQSVEESQQAGLDNNTMDTMAMAANSQTENSMQSSNAMTMAPTDPNLMKDMHKLAIRIASEEFDEHVRYRVKVYGQKNSLWDSGVLELTGGHDTKRMGRVAKANLPWQTITYPIPIDANSISAIEVSFINDGTTPDGADRNLYVSRAMLGNRVWLSSDGKQTGKCARKKPGQQGSIYCPGTLRMEKSIASTDPGTDAPADDTIRVSSVTLSHAHAIQRKPLTEMAFILSDVEFNGRFWNTLRVKYVKHKFGYAIRLDTTSCWPECVIEWPACAKTDNYSNTTLSLELGKDSNHCMYNGLQTPDKKLAHALWMILDDLYKIASTDQKMQRKNIAQNYIQWRSLVDEMLNQLPSSPFFDTGIRFEVAPRPIVDLTLNEPLIKPVPAGRTTVQREKDLRLLLQNNKLLDLATLLLPTSPVSAIPESGATLDNILTDLSFQLK